MYSRRLTTNSTAACSEQTERLRDELAAADAVVIGAGAGLSTAAGFRYSGERFRQHFADFEKKYGFTDMYSGGFYPYPTPEEYWAYWSRYVYLNRYAEPAGPVYEALRELVRGKEYFVLTTNVDHCFQKAGFDKERLFYTQGDYGLFQCSTPCCNKTFGNEEVIRAMVQQQENLRVPSHLLPRCPHCGRPLAMNLRSDDRFVEDAGWHAAAQRYVAFLQAWQGRRVLFWELGVGYNTPGIIKYPFWQMTAQNPRAVYACINSGSAACPKEIQGQSLCISGSIEKAIEQLSALEI